MESSRTKNIDATNPSDFISKRENGFFSPSGPNLRFLPCSDIDVETSKSDDSGGARCSFLGDAEDGHGFMLFSGRDRVHDEPHTVFTTPSRRGFRACSSATAAAPRGARPYQLLCYKLLLYYNMSCFSRETVTIRPRDGRSVRPARAVTRPVCTSLFDP